MLDLILPKVKGFFMDPVATFRASAADPFGTVVTYFSVLLLIHAILCALVSAIGIEVFRPLAPMSFGMAVPVFVFIAALVGGFIMTFVCAAWLHLWVYIVGGRKGIGQTIYAVLYASTPRLLLGWIPFVGIIFALWSLILGILGIRELQGLSTGKTVLAVVIAILIPLIVIILIAAWFFVTVMSVTQMPVPPLNS